LDAGPLRYWLMTDCVFCKIVAGEIPSFKVYEDEEFLAFLDINPLARGHALLIPKAHFEDVFDIPEEVLGQLAARAKGVSEAICKGLGASGVNLLHASGKSAQQSVFHFHLHLIPRFENDGLNTWPKSNYSEEDFETICQLIKEEK